MKIQIKKKNYGGGGGGRVCGGGGGGQGECERRIEVFVKIQKKKIMGGRSGCGGQGGCERRIEVFGKIHTKKNQGGGVGVRWGGQVGGGVRVDVNALLGVGCDVGYGGCECI